MGEPAGLRRHLLRMDCPLCLPFQVCGFAYAGAGWGWVGGGWWLSPSWCHQCGACHTSAAALGLSNAPLLLGHSYAPLLHTLVTHSLRRNGACYKVCHVAVYCPRAHPYVGADGPGAGGSCTDTRRQPAAGGRAAVDTQEQNYFAAAATAAASLVACMTFGVPALLCSIGCLIHQRGPSPSPSLLPVCQVVLHVTLPNTPRGRRCGRILPHARAVGGVGADRSYTSTASPEQRG